MAVPKKKVSKSRRNMRRAHDGLKPLNISFDSKTGEPKLAHHVCFEDGTYNGRTVFVTKKQKRMLKQQEAEQSQDKQDQA